MARIYKLSCAGLRLLYKIRHHNGHGIHSPFVFRLITKVVEEKMPYHAYEDIRLHIDRLPNVKHYVKKHNLLSFRLVNYFNAKKILEIGSGTGVNTICLTAASTTTRCIAVETNEKKYRHAKKLYAGWDRDICLFTDKLPPIEDKQDCIFIDLRNYNKFSDLDLQHILKLVHPKSFVVVKGIRTNKHHQALWKSIIETESRTAVLDLFNIGIVFFDKQLYRWEYQISF